MKWKNRLTNYNFWISIVSATLLILQAFNIKLDIANINEIVTALLGLLVVIGIINDPTKSSKDADAESHNSSKNNSTKQEQLPNSGEQEGENLVKTEIPSDKQNENDYDLAENDLQVLVDKISQDLEQKYAALNKAVDLLNNANQPSTTPVESEPVETILPAEQGQTEAAEINIEQPQDEALQIQPEQTAELQQNQEEQPLSHFNIVN